MTGSLSPCRTVVSKNHQTQDDTVAKYIQSKGYEHLQPWSGAIQRNQEIVRYKTSDSTWGASDHSVVLL